MISFVCGTSRDGRPRSLRLPQVRSRTGERSSQEPGDNKNQPGTRRAVRVHNVRRGTWAPCRPEGSVRAQVPAMAGRCCVDPAQTGNGSVASADRQGVVPAGDVHVDRDLQDAQLFWERMVERDAGHSKAQPVRLVARSAVQAAVGCVLAYVSRPQAPTTFAANRPSQTRRHASVVTRYVTRIQA
jgi:hypothetical protein